MGWLEEAVKSDTSLEVLLAATAPMFIILNPNELLDEILCS